MEIINFEKEEPQEEFFLNIDTEADIDEMDAQQLTAYRQQVEDEIRRLDALEPRNARSEAYEAWGDAHEVLEDILDDVLDRFEDLQEE